MNEKQKHGYLDNYRIKVAKTNRKSHYPFVLSDFKRKKLYLKNFEYIISHKRLPR